MSSPSSRRPSTRCSTGSSGPLSSQRRFLDDAGHELRTPITIIRGHLELLEDDPEERAATLALLLDELDRMSRMVNELVLLAKAEHRTSCRPRRSISRRSPASCSPRRARSPRVSGWSTARPPARSSPTVSGSRRPSCSWPRTPPSTPGRRSDRARGAVVRGGSAVLGARHRARDCSCRPRRRSSSASRGKGRASRDGGSASACRSSRPSPRRTAAGSICASDPGSGAQFTIVLPVGGPPHPGGSRHDADPDRRGRSADRIVPREGLSRPRLRCRRRR